MTTTTHDDLTPSVQELRERVDQHFDELLDELKTLVSIPSVSSLPEHQDDVQKSAEHVSKLFNDLGLSADRVSQPLLDTPPSSRERPPSCCMHTTMFSPLVNSTAGTVTRSTPPLRGTGSMAAAHPMMAPA